MAHLRTFKMVDIRDKTWPSRYDKKKIIKSI